MPSDVEPVEMTLENALFFRRLRVLLAQGLKPGNTIHIPRMPPVQVKATKEAT